MSISASDGAPIPLSGGASAVFTPPTSVALDEALPPTSSVTALPESHRQYGAFAEYVIGDASLSLKILDSMDFVDVSTDVTDCWTELALVARSLMTY